MISSTSEDNESVHPPPVNRCLSFSKAAHPEPGVAGDGGGSMLVDGSLVKSLSFSNMKKRVDRLMTPKADGKFKVPQELVHEWKHGDQKKLVEEFHRAGLDKDTYRVFTFP